MRSGTRGPGDTGPVMGRPRARRPSDLCGGAGGACHRHTSHRDVRPALWQVDGSLQDAAVTPLKWDVYDDGYNNC